MEKQKNKYSQFKLAWFPDKLNALRNKIVTPPISSLINPTNRCNHDCFFCVYSASYSGMHDDMKIRDELSKEKLFEILDDFKDMGVRAVTYSGGGEPLLHPNILEVLRKTTENGIDLSMITNGQLLKGEKAEALKDAKWVRISIDYYDAKGFKKSQRGSERMFNEVVENVKNFAKIKNPNCDLTCNWVITKENYKDLYVGTEFIKSLGVENIKFSAVWVKDLFEYHEPIEKEVRESLEKIKKDLQDENFKVYENYNITINDDVLVRKYHKCFFMQVVTNIGADGIVYNCHNKGYDKTGMVGSIKEQSFKRMWNSPETAGYFEEFDSMAMCKHQCAPDQKNLFIHDVINASYDNFI